jgi:hypothetical protein
LHNAEYSNRTDRNTDSAQSAGNSRHRMVKANASKEERVEKSQEFVVNPNEE